MFSLIQKQKEKGFSRNTCQNKPKTLWFAKTWPWWTPLQIEQAWFLETAWPFSREQPSARTVLKERYWRFFGGKAPRNTAPQIRVGWSDGVQSRTLRTIILSSHGDCFCFPSKDAIKPRGLPALNNEAPLVAAGRDSEEAMPHGLWITWAVNRWREEAFLNHWSLHVQAMVILKPAIKWLQSRWGVPGVNQWLFTVCNGRKLHIIIIRWDDSTQPPPLPRYVVYKLKGWFTFILQILPCACNWCCGAAPPPHT